jgi:spoIIIJ-associated protein
LAEYEDDEFTEDEDLEEFDDEEVEETEDADSARKPKSRDAKEDGEEEDVDPIADLLFDVLDILDLDAEIELEEREDHVRYHIEGQDLGVLIGRHGQTLEALQFLVGVINARKQLVDYRVIIDVEGYRDRREKQLRDLARRKAQQACREGKRIVLDPMPPVDRRIIHMALANSTSVKTYSEGEEPERCVVIAPGDQD